MILQAAEGLSNFWSWIAGSTVIGGAVTFLLNRLITKWTRSKEEKQAEQVTTAKISVGVNTAQLGFTEAEIKVRENQNKRAWSTVARLEGIIESLRKDGQTYRERIEKISEELSNVKLELVSEKEYRQLLERKLIRYNIILHNVIDWMMNTCPEIKENFETKFQSEIEVLEKENINKTDYTTYIHG